MDRTNYDDAIQGEVDTLAQRLRRSVLVNDSLVRILYRSAHFGDEDPLRIRALLQRDTGSEVVNYIFSQGLASWTGPGRIPPNPSLGMVHPRVCTPIRAAGRARTELIGMIMMVDPEDSLTNEELALIGESARRLAPLLEAQQLPVAVDRHREQAVLNLLSDDSSQQRSGLKSLGLEYLEHFAVLKLAVHDPKSSELRQAQARVALRGALGAQLTEPSGPAPLHRLPVAAEPAAVLVLVAHQEHQLSAEALSAEMSRVQRSFAKTSPADTSLMIGCGSPMSGTEQVHASARQAEIALSAVQRGLVRGPAAHWSQLGPLGVLLGLPPESLRRSILPEEMQRLLKAVPFDELIRTLHLYLDHGGNGPAAAEALHIHRTTLYYRLSRISELTGLDLADGRTRLSLHLGLKMLSLLPEQER